LGIAAMVPFRRFSTGGLVAPETAMVHPSHDMPASQKAWSVLRGRIGSRSSWGPVSSSCRLPAVASIVATVPSWATVFTSSAIGDLLSWPFRETAPFRIRS